MRTIHLWGFICLLITFAGPSYGDYLFNNRNTLVGGKAALMGGAYTALSEDLSGAYYNPAGIVSSSSTTELPMTIYSLKMVDRVNTTNGIIFSNTGNSLSTLPTSLGKIWKLSDSLATSIALFRTDDLDFRSTGYSTLFSGFGTVELTQQTWLGGPSISKRITPNFDAGISFFLQYSSVRFLGRFDSDILMGDRQNDVWSLGLIPVVGLKWRLNDDLKLGMAWSGETHNLEGLNHAIYQPLDISPPFRAPIQYKDGKGDIRTPGKLSLGLAQKLSCHCSLSLDYVYYLPLDYAFPNEPLRTTESTNHHKEKSHHDISLGGEWHSEDAVWTVLGGLFTNTSSATSQNLSEKVDSNGLSLGLSKNTKIGQISGGIVAQYGSSPSQVSDYLPGGGYAESASWKRTQINFLMGLTIPFDNHSSNGASQQP